eukprot:8977568-Pyramimonas_sp.AAC.1
MKERVGKHFDRDFLLGQELRPKLTTLPTVESRSPSGPQAAGGSLACRFVVASTRQKHPRAPLQSGDPDGL